MTLQLLDPLPKANDLPLCVSSWCQNKARWTVPHYLNEDGTDGPLINVCKTHGKIYAESNENDRLRQEVRARKQRAATIVDLMNYELERLGLTARVEPSKYGARVDISNDAAEEIANYLADQMGPPPVG